MGEESGIPIMTVAVKGALTEELISRCYGGRQ